MVVEDEIVVSGHSQHTRLTVSAMQRSQACAAKPHEEDLRFCAAVSAAALWAAGPFSPAHGDVQGEGNEDKKKSTGCR